MVRIMRRTITKIVSNVPLDYEGNYTITLEPGEFVSVPRFRLNKEGEYEDACIDVEVDSITRAIYLFGQNIELWLFTEEGLYGIVKGTVTEISDYGIEIDVETFTQTAIVDGNTEEIVFDIPNNSLKINGVERLQERTSNILKETKNGTT